jgi:hypothetical protein
MVLSRNVNEPVQGSRDTPTQGSTMPAMVEVLVHCHRNGVVLTSYTFQTTAPSTEHPLNHRELVDQAKANLATDNLAFPPWPDIVFEVESL